MSRAWMLGGACMNAMVSSKLECCCGCTTVHSAVAAAGFMIGAAPYRFSIMHAWHRAESTSSHLTGPAESTCLGMWIVFMHQRAAGCRLTS